MKYRRVDGMSSHNRIVIPLSALLVIGIILIGTGLFFNIFTPGDGETTTTTDTTTTMTTTAPTTTTISDVHNPYQVAIVFATGSLGDKGVNDGVYGGVLNTRFDYNVNFTYVKPALISDYEQFHRSYAAHAGYIEPYDLIIGVGFDQEVAIETVAGEYPNQKWAIVDMYIDPIVYPNVASLLFKEHEGSALVGAIAGLTTATNKIGFIGGMDIPLTNKYAAGYVFGAGYMNSNFYGNTNISANVSIGYTNDWVDTTAGRTLADGMYDADVDIIFASAGRAGLGVFDSVKDKNTTSSELLWCIGVDTPQMYLGTTDPDNPVAPTLCLTSMLKRVDIAVYTIIEDWVHNEVWQTGYNLLYFFNIANGGVGYEINTSLLTLDPTVISAVEDFKAQIIAGTVTVPDAIYW
jgi:basic membrane protein A